MADGGSESKKTILVINQNISGMNHFLFTELKKEFNLIVEDVPEPSFRIFLLKLFSFHPSISQWKSRIRKATQKYSVSAKCFLKRSVYARALVKRHEGQYDAILQLTGMFDSLSIEAQKPKFLFVSYNTHLAYHEWRKWAPFDNKEAFIEWYRQEKKLYNSADNILCTNQYAMNSLMADYGISSKKLTNIGYGINFQSLPEFTKQYASENPVALFVGYDFERKGGKDVVEAFKIVRQKLAYVTLRIVGPPELDEQYKVPGIEFLGEVSDREEMKRQFEIASFYVMPSICEPFGLVFLEAMAYKNPCIGSTNNAMPEIIESGKTGYTAPPNSPKDLAGYMEALYSDEELRRQMGEAAFRRVKDKFTWEVTGENVRNAIRAAV